MQLARAAAVAGVLIIAPVVVARAQRETDSAKTVRHSGAEANLAKAAQNPVANMVTLPLQYNYTTGGGLDSSTALLLNLQPVLPLPIGEKWLVISRTVVPFVSIPLPTVKVPLSNGNDSLAILGTSHGIGDIQEQVYFTKAKPGKLTWGVGPILSFPTATSTVARTGQWGAGPTVVALVMPRTWVIGILANNIWRIGGDAHGHVLNTFTTQPFINFNLPRAWAISTGPVITSNWSAASGQRWTVPIGAGVSKVTHVGEQPLNFIAQYYHNINHPRFGGSESVRLEVAALWPTAASEAAKKKEAGEAEAKKKPEQ